MSKEAIGKRFGDISDLPKDLLEELEKAKTAKHIVVQVHIIEVLKQLDNEASIDEILIGYYRKFNVVLKRKYLAGRLMNMCGDGLVEATSGRKGVYKLKQ